MEERRDVAASLGDLLPVINLSQMFGFFEGNIFRT